MQRTFVYVILVQIFFKINLVKINSNAKEYFDKSRLALEQEAFGPFVLHNLDDWRRMMTRSEPENQLLTTESNDSFNKKVLIIKN